MANGKGLCFNVKHLFFWKLFFSECTLKKSVCFVSRIDYLLSIVYSEKLNHLRASLMAFLYGCVRTRLVSPLLAKY